MLTDWGVRSLSSDDEDYDPRVYQRGMVWGLTTGWLALAAFEAGEIEIGLRTLRIMAQRIGDEGGMYHKAYLGDKPEPYHSCILQAWNLSTFVWALIKGLFGLSRSCGKVKIAPEIPEDWEALIEGLKVCSAMVNFKVDGRKRKIVIKCEAERIRVETPKEAVEIVEGEEVELSY